MAGTAWTDEETITLIEIWGEEAIQAQLEGCKRNIHVYEKIARELCDAGYERTGKQCREKIKKLKGDYKKIKDNNSETGRKRKNWRFYDAVNEVLGCKPATTPPVVFDTLADVPQDGELYDTVDSVGNETNSSTTTDEVTTGEQNNSTDTEPEVATESKNDNKIKKGKKRGREDKFEKSINAMGKIMESFKENDAMLLNLEEKRMNLDMKLIEMEDRRIREDKEREERMKQEEREFQLQLFSIIHSHGAHAHGTPPTQPFY